MEAKSKQKMIISLTILCISIVALTTSLTYAYFVSQIGTNEQEQVTITSGTLSLTFRDNDETVENIEGSWNFGDTIEKELVIENTGTKDTYAKISWDNLINTYLAGSLTYTLEEKTDAENSIWKQVETESLNVPRSETASTVLLIDHLSIPAGHTYTYRLRITLEDLPDIDQTADLNARFVTKFTIAEGIRKLTTEDKLENLGIKVKEPQDGVPNFANPASTDETAEGLFSMEDDYGTSYYYRGTAPNNYVKFGVNAEGQDMWWRIIRFNGDETIRMQYDGIGEEGSNTYTQGYALTGQSWNAKDDDEKYVGWMFGGAQGVASTSKEEAQKNETDSNIKVKVDEWYKKNLYDTGYHQYIADTIFCNDRSIPGKSITQYSGDTGLGYGKNNTMYGGYSRFAIGKGTSATVARDNPQPQFICPQDNDKFTVEESSGGNGALTYPVGLITADEIVAAGSGKYSGGTTTNRNYYLMKNPYSASLTITPFGDYGTEMFILKVDYLSHEGTSKTSSYQLPINASPVINLKAEYLNQLKGQGTLESPFHLETT